ncbi:MAG: two-component system phosphate regulon response regulator PhoB [Gammaproteobacteria bacterium]|jgi:two-component system phosphate regulon response regulator PhoB
MNAPTRVLVVEDETALREMLAQSLREAGYSVDEAANVSSAWQRIRSEPPQLILLDWMLPDVSGFEFLRSLRRDTATHSLPVIMLTAKGEETDRVRGLDAGADDYIPKPFSLRELRARVQAVLRRSGSEEPQTVSFDGLEIDLERHRVSANSTEIHLSPTEFRLLHFLISHPQRVYSRSQLLDNAWGQDTYVEERTVDVQVRRLRKALIPYDMAGYIQTVRGFGYRFARP